MDRLGRQGARILIERSEPARSYAEWFETSLGRRVWNDELRALWRLLRPVPRSHVLDAGAGDGRLAVELAAEGFRVTALDLSASMLGLAHERARSTGVPLDIVQGDIESLPFPPAAFRQVVVVTVLCFLPEPRRALAELTRVLAPGGTLVVGELGPWSLWNLRRRARGWRGDPLWRRSRFRGRRALKRLARGAGLIPDGWETAVFYSPQTYRCRVSRTLERILAGRTSLGAAFVAMRAVKPVTKLDGNLRNKADG